MYIIIFNIIINNINIIINNINIIIHIIINIIIKSLSTPLTSSLTLGLGSDFVNYSPVQNYFIDPCTFDTDSTVSVTDSCGINSAANSTQFYLLTSFPNGTDRYLKTTVI